MGPKGTPRHACDKPHIARSQRQSYPRHASRTTIMSMDATLSHPLLSQIAGAVANAGSLVDVVERLSP